MKNHEGEYTIRAYTVGFVLSLGLTLVAYLSVVNHKFKGNALLYLIAWLALIQFFVQLVFFLHLGRETKPRWKLVVFWFMTLIVGILVAGSLWIMTNLNYHHVDHKKSSDTYIIQDEGIKP